ncbi:MAG: hypothetical protein WDM70_10205 [Nitrosomonadales bacterium]
MSDLGVQGPGGCCPFLWAGYTLALDLPIRDEGLFVLLNKLDKIVLQHGGRVYLAKDARLSVDSFRSMYPRYEEWLKIKHGVDPKNCIQLQPVSTFGNWSATGMSETVLILGATSAIARATATAFAARGDALYLASRDLDELRRLAADLHVRHGVEVRYGLFGRRGRQKPTRSL